MCWSIWTIPTRVVASLRATLKPGGNLIVLVPRGPALFGSLDRSLGHKRRYSAADLRQLLESQGFRHRADLRLQQRRRAAVVGLQQNVQRADTSTSRC